MEHVKELYERKYGFLKIFLMTLKMGIKADPIQFFICAVLDLCNGLTYAFVAVATQRFFDHVGASTSVNKNVILSIIFLGGVYILAHVINGTGHTLIPNMKHKMDRNAMIALNRKIALFPADMFEYKEFLDFVNMAYKGTGYSFDFLVPLLRCIFLYLPYTIFMSVYLYHMEPVLILSILMVYLPTALSYLLRPGILIKLEDESVPLRRQCEYYQKCITDISSFKETRILGAFHYFMNKYKASLNGLGKKVWKARRKLHYVDILSGIFAVAGYGGVLILLVYLLMNGRITAGMFAAVLSSLTYIFIMVDETLYHFLESTNGIATVRNFLAVLDFKLPEKKHGTVDLKGDIILKDITYQYPGSHKKVIDNLNLVIRQGETLAIVGENGSGKTTLSKIILGLYTPCSGSVMVNDKILAEYETADVSWAMSAVFQKFQKYKMTLRENIAFDSEHIKDYEVLNCLGESDMEVSDFHEGLDTMLSREFGGTELSGGQWQRIAIARGLYKINDVIVLDEPTSAIDPIEETKIFEEFAKIASDKTAILITHRIGSAKIADRIIVMNDGGIIETGTHEELLDQQGMYYKLFRAQQKWYE